MPVDLTRDQSVPVDRALELAGGAIALFLEYRDIHGHTEDQARAAALLDVLEGERAREEIAADQAAFEQKEAAHAAAAAGDPTAAAAESVADPAF